MATKIYTDRTEAETEAKRLNSERKRTNIEFVVGTNYINDGVKLTPNGYYIGCCSDD